LRWDELRRHHHGVMKLSSAAMARGRWHHHRGWLRALWLRRLLVCAWRRRLALLLRLLLLLLLLLGLRSWPMLRMRLGLRLRLVLVLMLLLLSLLTSLVMVVPVLLAWRVEGLMMLATREEGDLSATMMKPLRRLLARFVDQWILLLVLRFWLLVSWIIEVEVPIWIRQCHGSHASAARAVEALAGCLDLCCARERDEKRATGEWVNEGNAAAVAVLFWRVFARADFTASLPSLEEVGMSSF
jgi:hypothetical protein